MARKKKHPEHPNHERWLVSYADFITLLFAFFVVMFAVSQVDSNKVGRFTESVRAVTLWNGPQLVTHSETKPAASSASILPTNIVASRRPAGAELRLIRDLLRERLRNAIISQRISVEQEDVNLIVRLQDAGFFEAGSDQLRVESVRDLRLLGEAIRDLPYPVRIEGHTDSLPIRNNPRHRSNWELSAARAVAVLECLHREAGLDEKRCSIAGYADKHPVASNATEKGRRKNRRVDVVLIGSPDRIEADWAAAVRGAMTQPLAPPPPPPGSTDARPSGE